MMAFKQLLAASALVVSVQAQGLTSQVCSSVDTNADGGVDIRDLLAVLSFFNVDCGVDGASPNTPWRKTMAPDTCPEACIREGWDYGGNAGNGCGFAPIVAIITDHLTWATNHTPGWYGGPVSVVDFMSSPQACQNECAANADCDGFAFEYEETGSAYYHECYLKSAYADPFCNIDPYVVWRDQSWASGRGDPNWHAASGPKTCADSNYAIDYTWFDISTTGTAIGDLEWTNPGNDNGWPDDDGWVDVALPFSFMWFGMPEASVSVGTNGLITFGGPHLRNGASEPIPCLNFCERSQNYGSHAAHHSFGVDGVIAPLWSDINPCGGTDGPANVCGGNGGGGTVYYQTYADALVVQWEQVRNYVAPDPASTQFPGCSDSANWWTSLCPASQDPTSSTFQAILFDDGGVLFAYKEIPVIDPTHWASQDASGGTGLSWSKVSIGYEDKSGSQGDQITYGLSPASGSSYYVPPVCTLQAEPVAPVISVAQCPEPCVQAGMDYGGGVEPRASCGYAPIVQLITDVTDFAAPSWVPISTYSAGMKSAYDCQAACATNVACDFFSYEYQARNWTQPYVHRCYLKAGFAGYNHTTNEDNHGQSYSICNPAYVVWNPHDLPNGRPDPSWYGASGPGVCPPEIGASFNAEYSFFDIANSGQAIGDTEWTNPHNTWADDDGWYDIDLSKPFMWFGARQMMVSAGTNGLITFGTHHLRNGASEPIPCAGFCGRNTGSYGDTGYGSHESLYDWGVDGLIAPLWSDMNPCGGTDGPANVCGGNGGGGQVIFQEFGQSLVIQWEAVRNYVDPNPASTLFPGCADEANWWGPACPASQLDVTSTFQAVLYMDGTLAFNYKDIPVVDPAHPNTNGRGTGLSWSPASIGFEDITGYKGVQISYDVLPMSETSYVVPALCHSDADLPAATISSPWRPATAADTCPEACVKMDMDFGGRLRLDVGLVCDYAPILVIYTDDVAWATTHAPGWYSGDIITQANMTSPYECQKRCDSTPGCAGFAYEYEFEPADSAYYHECYVKAAYAASHSSTDPRAGTYDFTVDGALTTEEVGLCMEYPFVPWTEASPNYHSASAVAGCSDGGGGYKIDYIYQDIKGTGSVITDGMWTNPLNTWADDDGMFDVPLPFGFLWFGQVEDAVTVGTNGIMTFGANHLRNGGSEPIPCVDFCGRNERYGSHGARFEFGVDGLLAPFWNDLNPCSSGNVCNGNGGGGAVVYQVFTDAAIIQWEQVRYYVDPDPTSTQFPGCADSANWWTSLCPASQDPTSNTFQAVLFADGGVMFSYKNMAPVDTASHDERGTGLSWSPASIGYEDRSGTMGDQITYDFVPPSMSSYYIPPVCTSQDLTPPTAPTLDYNASTCPEECVKQGMDYGGRLTLTTGDFTGLVCNFAPILVIYTDDLSWASNHTPGWYGGDVVVDETMDSAYACQRKCADTPGCEGFAYEYENSTLAAQAVGHVVGDGGEATSTYFHECYIKGAFSDRHSSSVGGAGPLTTDEQAACMEYPYVVWSSADYASGAGDLNWHCASGPPTCSNGSPFSAPYTYTDISRTGQAIGDTEWVNPFNTWADDDGWYTVSLAFAVPWFGLDETSLNIGTNGLITFGGNHLRNGASEPLPCLGFCGRNTGGYGNNGYGSHGRLHDWGVDGVIAPLWSDLNPCGGTDGPANVCGGNGGGGQVLFKMFAEASTPSLVVQWEAVRNYVDPDSNSALFPGCADSANWWTSLCPASQDPTSQTFQAIVFGDGGLSYNYKEIPSEDPDNYAFSARGTGLSWSPVSIGFESQAGDKGGQILYDELPNAMSTFYVPPSCSDASRAGPIYTLAEIYGDGGR